MEFFPDPKTFLRIGPLTVQWYALCILGGALIAYYLSLRNLKKRHYADDILSDYFVWLLWIGIIGARLWFCLFSNPAYFFGHPLKLIAIHEGGLAIHGGVIAGLIFSYFFCKHKNIDFRLFTDMVLPNVLVAQAIGRWGNFINREAHGGVVPESYYDGILSFLKEGMCIDGVYYQPTFFYEGVLNLIGFVLIVGVLKRHQNKRGDLAWAYCMWYGLVRFFIETMRTDALLVGGLKIAQITSIVGIIVGALGYFGFFERFFKERKPTLLFDLDGTLVNTEKAILTSFEKVFEEEGKGDLFRNEINVAVLGPSLEDSFKKYMPEKDTGEMVERYRVYNNEELKKSAELMPGAGEMLKELHEQGYNVGVVSVRNHTSAEMIIKDLKIDDYIGDLIGRNDVKKGKPDIEGFVKILEKNNWNRDEVVYTGDSDIDIEAAKNYGAFSIGFFYNEKRREKLEKAGANAYIDNFLQLLPIVKQHYIING